MRDEWQTVKLGDVCGLDKSRHANGDMPYVGMEHIESHTGRFLGDLAPKSVGSATFQFTSKHLLYGRLRPYLNKVMLPSFAGHCSSEIFPIECSERVLRSYLFYWITWQPIVNLINETCTGARMPRANVKEVLDFAFPLPPLPEQERIVAILDKAFEGIDQAIAHTEQNLASARELFESYLNNIFTQRGDGWVEKKLGDVCDLAQGLAINAKTKHLLVESSSLPLLRIKDLRGGRHEQYVADEGYPEKSRVFEEDVIYTRTGQIGLVFKGRSGVLHNNSFKVTPIEELSKEFIFWFLQSPKFKKTIVALASRAAQPDITHKLFKEQFTAFPSLAEQAAIVERIEFLNKQSKQLEVLYAQKLKSLEELKQSLLQQAFAGKLTKEVAA